MSHIEIRDRAEDLITVGVDPFRVCVELKCYDNTLPGGEYALMDLTAEQARAVAGALLAAAVELEMP